MGVGSLGGADRARTAYEVGGWGERLCNRWLCVRYGWCVKYGVRLLCEYLSGRVCAVVWFY